MTVMKYAKWYLQDLSRDLSETKIFFLSEIYEDFRSLPSVWKEENMNYPKKLVINSIKAKQE